MDHLRRLVIWAVLASGAVMSGCSIQGHKPLSPDVTGQQDAQSFPYHPLVYHLDLSTLAYQLHAQSLVWPFDPYYEALPGGDPARAGFMRQVRRWASVKGAAQVSSGSGVHSYRGPGRLAGFRDNPLHDPILYRYDRIAPWNSTITNGGTRWVEYLPSRPITDEISDVYLCKRISGRAADAVSVTRIASNPAAPRPWAKDVLLAFEGSTGDKGEDGHPASQSLMGFVLLRHRPGGNSYVIHIAFRGSRSGSLLRTVAQANWNVRAGGNPDWITDLGYDLIGAGENASHITTVGGVHRGFARTVELTLPNIMACLDRAASLEPGTSPENIYVTGHSLGGGLAQQFVSAVLLGDRFGPGGQGSEMPRRLQNWPWQQIKLITYSAPRAGDPTWARTLTEDGLASDFHSRDRRRYDFNALASNDPGIPARLNNRESPAAYRVLVSTDPVSTSIISGRKPVGKTVYVDRLGPLAIAAPPNPASHDPEVVRELLVESLRDSEIPAAVWRYRRFSNALPGDSDQHNEQFANYTRLQTEFLTYHHQNSPGTDSETYRRDFRLFNQLLALQ